jgi:hypothetical protein
VVPNLDSNQTKRFLSDLTNPDTKMICCEKFITIYDDMTETFNDNELNAHMADNSDLLNQNKVMFTLMQAIDAKGISFKDFFSQYEFQRQMMTISNSDFFIACGDLGILEEDIHYDDVAKLFDSGKASTLDLSPLDNFIKSYKTDIPFYI